LFKKQKHLGQQSRQAHRIFKELLGERRIPQHQVDGAV
jgi:hypothetical protein